MPILEGYKKSAYLPTMAIKEEAIEKKELKIPTPSKLLTRLPVLLAQIKAKNNSYKLKDDIR